MKQTLVLLTTALLGVSFQAQAVTVKEYVAVRGGYAATKHQTSEHYEEVLKPVKNDWNSKAGIGSVAYGLKAGYLRAELEGNATSTTKETKRFYTEGSDVKTTARINTASVMFNSYLELPVDFPVRPYISAGVGMAHIKGKFKNQEGQYLDNSKVSGNHLAWQIGAGLACEITPEWAVDIGYRVMDYGTISKKIVDYENGYEKNYLGKLRLDAKIYTAYIGARYSF